MVDRTVVARVKRQREYRVAEGWEQVTVWVPTEADAEDIRKLARERRERAEALQGLSQEVKIVSPETEARIAAAIAEHGSAAYNTPSGAVLDLMTQLAAEDDLPSFSRAVIILARAKPANAAFVTAAVPPKVSNFLIRHRSISPAALMTWTNEHSGWADELKEAVRKPDQFERVVEAMAEAIKRETSNIDATMEVSEPN